ncbi:MAG: DEAD/DEAH box helicase [Bacteroidaceae bacterium]|nr:DEAD/DEAH box helicase [Bacteroidaceae bacterium]
MSLSEWQIALRKQIAQEEHFGISCVDDKLLPGEYSVKSPKTKQEYKVVYRGAKSEWNYCSCFDFKTAQLGTCKHLEAVKQWIGSNRRQRVHQEIPPYTSVYLRYLPTDEPAGENGDVRKVCIRIGSDHRQEYEQLANQYFDHNGVMLEETFQKVEEFAKQAVAISDNFRFYHDAIDFIIEKREAHFRQHILHRYTDEMLDKLLTVTLYPYQKEGIRFAFAKGKSIIADEMGLGKTIQAIGTAELMRKEKLVQSTLIICPTSLKYQWKREIERFTGQQVHVIEGLHHKRVSQYQLDVPYKIISYNSACNDIKVLGKLETDLLIMDEVQRLKNWNTQISMAMRRVVSQYAVILSGTPLENKLEELYSVMEFADQFCLGPFWKFKAECIVSDETGKVIGYQNLNKVGEMARQRLIRRTKKQVALQMPKRQDKILFVPMTKEQRAEHDELKFIVSQIVTKWRRMHFLSEKDRNRLMLSLSQMRMLCDSTYILDQRTRNDTKVDEALNIITSLLESEGEKVVVFSQWERMTRLIAQELEKREIGFEYLHGGVPSEARGRLITNFADNPDSRVFLSTDAGSTGLNLQSAATIINLDLPWNPAVLEQRIARIYRLGQQRNVQVINLVSTGTIEEQMLDKLRFKSAMFEGVLDNGQDAIFLGEGSKLSQMMDTLGEMMDKPEQHEPGSDGTLQNQDTEIQAEPANDHTTETTPTDVPSEEYITETEAPREDAEENPAAPTQDDTESPQPQGLSTPKDLIAQGTAFLSGLAATLKSPEATEQLINSLVETDAETGQTSLKIPVPDKQTVRNLLDIVGKLFG